MFVSSLKKIVEKEGMLIPFELSKEIPFKPKRIFYITNVPKGTVRGQHAHYKTHQILICIKGSITVTLWDGKQTQCIERNLIAGDYIHVPPMVWDSQIYHTGEDILLSICSTNYDKSDYITDIKEFKKLTTNNYNNIYKELLPQEERQS